MKIIYLYLQHLLFPICVQRCGCCGGIDGEEVIVGDKDNDGVIDGRDDGEDVGVRDGIADGAGLNGIKNIVVSLDPKSPPSAINPPFVVATL